MKLRDNCREVKDPLYAQWAATRARSPVMVARLGVSERLGVSLEGSLQHDSQVTVVPLNRNDQQAARLVLFGYQYYRQFQNDQEFQNDQVKSVVLQIAEKGPHLGEMKLAFQFHLNQVKFSVSSHPETDAETQLNFSLQSPLDFHGFSALFSIGCPGFSLISIDFLKFPLWGASDFQ